ncbi:hypothetical protein GALL_13200 [mine drainage metagenome]|uniref:DUF1302 domain-containing protein n=1 Tax=mine drainage metagenome TaxID=410659 RepID=A0A1J5TRW0_9ZZZZ
MMCSLLVRPDSRRAKIAGVLPALCLLLPLTARAVRFNEGELKGSFDTTISVGVLDRLQNPSPAYYGTSSTFDGVPGLQNSVNADDGNLNFPKGIASELAKVNHEFELHYRDSGFLASGYYFYDAKVQNDWQGRTPLSDAARSRVGKGGRLLDLYAYTNFDVAGHPVEVRVGRQVLSLGESTFIPNGINVINPYDLSKLRVPGAELKDALLPITMVKGSIGLTDNLTVEPFWILEFQRNEIEPAGTYFSTNDFASRGGDKVMLGFGRLPDSGTLGAIPRTTDRTPHSPNEGGLAVHWTDSALNDTEFGFFVVRYNSRSPVVSAITPTAGVNPNLTGPLTAVFMQAGMAPAAAAAQATGLFQLVMLSQTNPAALTPTQIATLQAPSTQAALAGAQQIALLTAASNGRYFVELPEGITMLGASFNASLGNTGISWQGEVSYKDRVPLQIDDVELLYAALSSLSPVFGANNQVGSYLGQYGREVSGYRRHQVWTAQTTMTKTLGSLLGSSQTTVLAEVGGVWVNLPDKSVLRYDGQGTFTSGSAAAMAATTNPPLPATPASAFADSFSWGYQAAARLDYENAFFGVNAHPLIAFTHDVSGNTPLPLGNFVRGRKSLTLGADFTYLDAWELDLRYVNFFGGGAYNLLADRDYVSATVKYSF